MQVGLRRTVALQTSIVLATIGLALALFAVFGYYAFVLVRGIFERADTIPFNKGAVYMLGVGLTAALLAYFFVYEMLNKKILPSFNKTATRLAVAFIAAIFVLPQLAHYGVSRYLVGIGYTYCAQKSYRWLHAQNLVFVADEKNCAVGK